MTLFYRRLIWFKLKVYRSLIGYSQTISTVGIIFSYKNSWRVGM